MPICIQNAMKDRLKYNTTNLEVKIVWALFFLIDKYLKYVK